MSQAFDIQSRCIDVLAEVVQQHGKLEGRVRIQKIMYLLRRSAPEVLEGVNFYYHHYGPFSPTVVDSVMGALSWRVLDQRVETYGDDIQRYVYSPGPGFEQSAEPLDPSSKSAVTRLVGQLKKEHWRTLELAATVDFLEQSDHLARSEALKRALRLKPACLEYSEPAMALLDRLGLPPLRDRAIVSGH